MILPKLEELVLRVDKHNFQGRLLAVDPGETTGITIIDKVWPETHLRHQAQIQSWPLELAVKGFQALFLQWVPTFMVFEAYHVYRWRLQEHSFSEVPTIQIIGALRTVAILNEVPMVEQTAQTGKAFFSDDKLKSLGLYFEGQRHARDSLRHAAQYLTFGINQK